MDGQPTAAIDIKICGLTNVGDVQAALNLEVDYIGFVLYAGSPRGIREEQLKVILGEIEVAAAVGVFVDTPPEDVARIATECGLCAVQLHGDDDPAACRDIGVPVWRAVRFTGGRPVPDPETWPADRYVVDANVEGLYGGTGQVADWDAAAVLAAQRPVMLAGGLMPDNVAEAIARVKPQGVDTASGVESEPGRKDLAKLEQFVNRARMTDDR